MIKRIFRWTYNIIIGLLFISAIVLVVLPAVFSSSLAVVYTGSMEPDMPAGALALMSQVNPEDIQVGDIIAFDPPWDEGDVTVSHRVVSINESENLSFVTKGDANEDPDFDVIYAENVKAKVVYNVPRVGQILTFLSTYTKSKAGFVLFVASPTLILIGTAVKDMNNAINPRKKRRKIIESLKKRRKKSL